MKKPAFLIAILLPLLICSKDSLATGKKMVKDSIIISIVQQDSLPPCIQALSRPPSKGIRSSAGAIQFRKEITLKNRKKIYAFYVQASIGCNMNEPTSTRYYNDACIHVATFYQNFTLTNGKKPFIANGYVPEDFPETLKGDYPSYFGKENNKSSKTNTGTDTVINTLFPTEKSFKILSVLDSALNFKKDDVIRISTASGLKHFRNNTLLNTYKIMPQIVTTNAVESNQIVYYLGAFQKILSIQKNTFLISTENFEDLNQPTTPVLITWKTALEVEAE